MKRIVSNEELKRKMVDAINLLCNTVKTTLGPKGSNVIIDHSLFCPFITNDGVTIAQNIESDDDVINTILEIAKESSIKTNESVGDGTTTTLVLLQSIFNQGLDLINDGENPIILKKELFNQLENIKKRIESKIIKTKKRDIINIAITSSNSIEIGSIIGEAYNKIGFKEGIKINEGEEDRTEVALNKGYVFDTLLASPYFLQDNKDLNMKDSYLLLCDRNFQNLEEIAEILNYIISMNKSLIIMANDYENEFVNQVLSLYLNDNVNVCLLKTPFFDKNKIDLYQDLSLITRAKIISDFNEIKISYLGKLLEININKENVKISFNNNPEIIKRTSMLKEYLKSSDEDIDKEFTSLRIAMLERGIIKINVGAKTITERREKKMRFDDALCAVNVSKSGILPGSGVVLYEIAENIESNSNAAIIFKNALKAPFIQIMQNAGLDEKEIINEIKISNYKKIYNIKTQTYDDINKTQVIDPYLVVVNSLINATSIAGMLLTTTSLVINEYKNELNKQAEFNEV